MTKRKPAPSVADRLAAVERELAAIKRLLTPQPKAWWEVAYPKAYTKENRNG